MPLHHLSARFHPNRYNVIKVEVHAVAPGAALQHAFERLVANGGDAPLHVVVFASQPPAAVLAAAAAGVMPRWRRVTLGPELCDDDGVAAELLRLAGRAPALQVRYCRAAGKEGGSSSDDSESDDA